MATEAASGLDRLGLVDLIEKNITDSIDRVTADLSRYLGISAFEAHSIFEPYIHPCAEALATSLVAGETAEQFEARVAALKIKES